MDDAQEQGFRKDLFARVAILLEDLPIWRKHGDIATQLHPLRVSRAVVMQRQSLLSIDALALAMAAEITTNITMSLIGEKRQIREENQAAMKAYARYFTSATQTLEGLLSGAQASQDAAIARFTVLTPEPARAGGLEAPRGPYVTTGYRDGNCVQILRYEGSLEIGFTKGGALSWTRNTKAGWPTTKARCHEGDGNETQNDYPTATEVELSQLSTTYRSAAADIVTFRTMSENSRKYEDIATGLAG